MLRTRIRACTGSTGVVLTILHGLAGTIDAWNIVELNVRGRSWTHSPPNTQTNQRICIANDIQTTVSVDVFCWAWQGRLY